MIKDIRFSDCTFEKVSDSVLPDYRKHGSADWGRVVNAPILTHTKNVVFHNTTFSVD